MSILNEKNKHTEKVIHLMITPLCDRKCPDCCNNQYDISTIPYVTHEELLNAEVLCLTGGEPFKYSNPVTIGTFFKKRYPNIKKVYAYTNAYEFGTFLQGNIGDAIWTGLDGVNVSIKNSGDKYAFESWISDYPDMRFLKENRLYVFNNLFPNEKYTENFNVIAREWQKNFVPTNDSIFRRI